MLIKFQVLFTVAKAPTVAVHVLALGVPVIDLEKLMF